uniref:(northern house mosquito) hypothetical protein n=1 Tax=Culex pipiens TaxID=7175 RepID=A0A8D8CR39_CULPI
MLDRLFLSRFPSLPASSGCSSSSSSGIESLDWSSRDWSNRDVSLRTISTLSPVAQVSSVSYSVVLSVPRSGVDRTRYLSAIGTRCSTGISSELFRSTGAGTTKTGGGGDDDSPSSGADGRYSWELSLDFRFLSGNERLSSCWLAAAAGRSGEVACGAGSDVLPEIRLGGFGSRDFLLFVAAGLRGWR